jgi:hypothetical protein
MHLLVYQYEPDGDWYWSWFPNKTSINTDDSYATDHNGPFASAKEAFRDASKSGVYQK